MALAGDNDPSRYPKSLWPMFGDTSQGLMRATRFCRRPPRPSCPSPNPTPLVEGARRVIRGRNCEGATRPLPVKKSCGPGPNGSSLRRLVARDDGAPRAGRADPYPSPEAGVFAYRVVAPQARCSRSIRPSGSSPASAAPRLRAVASKPQICGGRRSGTHRSARSA